MFYNYYVCSQHSLVFPILSGLRRPTEEKYNVKHPVANPQQFALRCDDILKILFFNNISKNVLACDTPEYCKWNPRMPGHPGLEPHVCLMEFRCNFHSMLVYTFRFVSFEVLSLQKIVISVYMSFCS